MDKYLGKRLEGRYEIQELIGTGGMANVYKAFDIIDERTVAVKILRDEYIDNTEFLRRFKNESKAIAVLSHPNIVKVFDVSFTGRIHSIVMEYIDGITLKDYIERNGVLVWKEAVHFTLQILRALQHAHDKGIVHRDIKPQNIMLLQNGTIKVTDFGIARFARSEVRTISDRAIGSVHYISPEQAMGDATDEKADIYSVGVMLFEMLTGQLPFEADTAVSVALKQIQSQAVKPRSLNPDIPEGLEEITIRAMQKDAARRYQSAAGMIADIEQFKQNPSIHFEYKYLESGTGAKKKKYRRAIEAFREEDSMIATKRRTPYIPILTGVTLAFVLASLSFIGLMVYLNNPFKQVAEQELPDLVGMKFETAAAQYDWFTIDTEERVHSDQYGSGVICEQKPKPGTDIRVGTTVRVKVSSGQLELRLPNYTGQDADTVFSGIEDKGLKYKEEYTFSSEYPAGTVIYTDPSKDSVVKSGAVITVYVSRGQEALLSTVPDLTGLNVEAAKRMLELSKLRLGEISHVASDKPADTIVEQSSAPGDLQPEGSAINIKVSKTGSKRVQMFIEMPPIAAAVSVRAYIDGTRVAEADPELSPAAIGAWKPVIAGEDGDLLNVKIYVNRKLYQEFELDFDPELDAPRQTLLLDNSGAEIFRQFADGIGLENEDS